jgi:hypothetical protein
MDEHECGKVVFVLAIAFVMVMIALTIVIGVSYYHITEEKDVTITKQTGDARHIIIGTSNGEIYHVSRDLWAQIDVGNTYRVKIARPIWDTPMIVEVGPKIIIWEGKRV